MPPFFVPFCLVALDIARIETLIDNHLPGIDPAVYRVDIEHHTGPEPALHLLLDTDAGITLGECVAVNRALRPLLEEAGLLPETYALEVSSPGVGSPLRLPRQYTKNIGRHVHVTLSDGTKLEALLQAVTEGALELQVFLPTRKGRKPVTQQRTVPLADIQETIVTVSFT